MERCYRHRLWWIQSEPSYENRLRSLVRQYNHFYAFKSDIVTVTDVGLSSATLSKLFLTMPKVIWQLDGQLSLLQNEVNVASLTGKTSQDVSAAQGDTFCSLALRDDGILR